MSLALPTYTDEDYHIEFRGYDYALQTDHDSKQMALSEASLYRQIGLGCYRGGEICRACVKQLSNGRWGVYIRIVTVR